MLKKDVECLKCGYKWRKRTDKPLRCPDCTNPRWYEPPVRKVVRRHGAIRLMKELKEKTEQDNKDKLKRSIKLEW